MKKVSIQYTDEGDIELSRFDGRQSFALYAGIAQVDGGWLLETNGYPLCLGSLEDEQSDDADARIDSVRDILSDPSTPWEECSEDDKEYIYDILRDWGIQWQE